MARRAPTKPDETQPLNEGERNLVALRLEGLSLREIAVQVDMHHSTVADTLNRPHVVAFMEAAHRDAQESLKRRISNLGTLAATTLRDVMTDHDAPHAARVAAARALLPVMNVIEGGDRPVHVSASVDVRTLSDAELERLASEPVPEDSA